MQIKTILKILGLLLACFSLTMLPPIIISYIYAEELELSFFIAFTLTFMTGFVLYLNFYDYRSELKSRDGFLIVTLFWTVLSLFAAIPMMIAPYPHESITDAIFEAVSGLTTTGATVINGIEQLSHAMLYYRQQLQFLGGMGIIVLAVAIMPMLGVGGMQLYQAETPGPFKEQKLAPRIATSAKLLWIIYVALTVACALGYWLAGMSPFEALGESFGTVSTGGFSMHDNSFAFYHSYSIELIAALFMFLGGVNFALHFQCFNKQSLKIYWQDEEARFYIWALLAVILVVTLALMFSGEIRTFKHALVKSIFNVISFSTTTGFTSFNISRWPMFALILITYLAIMGGCAASTSGGLKVVRVLLLQKQVKQSLGKLIHPQAVFSIKYGRSPLPSHIFESIWAFVAIFFMVFFALVLLLVSTGMDFTSSFSAATATLANAGAGIGQIGINFASLNVSSKWLLIVAMLAGRLEIFTLFILFVPSFWRK